MPQMTRSGPFL